MSGVSLEERYAGNPRLLSLYRKKLLEPNWAGKLDDTEYEYIKSQLRRSPALKRRWRFRPSAKRLSVKRVRAVAGMGV